MMLCVSPRRWTAYAIEAPDERVAELNDENCTPAQLATLLDPADNRKLGLILESEACLAATFAVASPRQARNVAALAYQLEEVLPVTAEQVVARFSVARQQAFGVAVNREWIEQLVAGLEDVGYKLIGVWPIATLTVAEPPRGRREVESCWYVRSDRLEQVVRQNGRSTHWRCWPADPVQFESQVVAHELVDGPVDVDCVVGPPSLVANYPRFVTANQTATQGDPCHQMAAHAIGAIDRGDHTAEIDLLPGISREADSRGVITVRQAVLLVSIAACLLCAASWRLAILRQVSSEVASLEAAEVDAFRAAMPQSRIPPVVLPRLESEYRRVSGSRIDLATLLGESDATTTLYRTLKALPPDLRFRVLEIRVEDDRVTMLGEARSYSDADAIAAAWRSAGFRVEPPSSRQLPDRGVEFRLSAAPSTTDEASS